MISKRRLSVWLEYIKQMKFEQKNLVIATPERKELNMASKRVLEPTYQFSIFNPKQAVYATTPAFNPMQAWPQMLYSSMLPTMPNATNASLATNAAAAAAAAIPRYTQ